MLVCEYVFKDLVMIFLAIHSNHGLIILSISIPCKPL